ncbi:MAG: hypothetical protein WAT70_06585 [Rhizobiaceae bacterium]
MTTQKLDASQVSDPSREGEPYTIYSVPIPHDLAQWLESDELGMFLKFGSEGALPTPLERIVMVLESARTQHHAATGKETDLPF